MSTKTNEFNAVKTIKAMHKDSLLQKVYITQTKSHYDYNGLLTAAEANSLADTAIQTLQDIYDSIIVKSDSHTEIYNEIKLKANTQRRYGKNQILVDIEAQGGVATGRQTGMLSLARAKAITATLHDRGVSDQFKNTTKITDAKWRKVNSAVRDFENNLKSILENK
jgi:hypothetical protein